MENIIKNVTDQYAQDEKTMKIERVAAYVRVATKEQVSQEHENCVYIERVAMKAVTQKRLNIIKNHKTSGKK